MSRTGNASWDDDHVGILEGSLDAAVSGQVAGNFLFVHKQALDTIYATLHVVRGPDCRGGAAYSIGGDVRQVSGNTGSVDNIVEDELVNEGGELEEERQWLCGNNPDVSRLRPLNIGLILAGRIDPKRGSHTCPMPPAAPATTNTYVVSKVGHATELRSELMALLLTCFDHLDDKFKRRVGRAGLGSRELSAEKELSC